MMVLFSDRVWRVNEGPQIGGHVWARRSGVWSGVGGVGALNMSGRLVWQEEGSSECGTPK